MTLVSPPGLWADSEPWPLREALRSASDVERSILLASGLIDAAWYRENNSDVAAANVDPLEHFLSTGHREGRRPNPYFDPAWYLAENPQIGTASTALLHYIAVGEAGFRNPVPHFDLQWYASRHAAESGRALLAHFLDRRCGGTVSPLAVFDPVFYLHSYPDIAAAGVDPFEHYLLYGYAEGRDPSAEFDTRFYLRRYLDGELSENPLVHFHLHRHHMRLRPKPHPGEPDAFTQVRLFSHPGPAFEEIQPLPVGARRLAKVLAFYLPQFHEIPENNSWWGRGFTEWTALPRGMPRFVGHYQPRTPRDLGHYMLGRPGDPAAASAVMRRQIALATGAGLFGFVQYYYWFNRRRLLEAPLEAYLADDSLDFPFCLMWANENWTRRWNGSEADVLIAQDYDAADDIALVDDFARHFQDRRYIRIGGRPLLMIYRADKVPDTAATLARWRRLFFEGHRENPILLMAQSFGCNDPRSRGFDGAIEFPPHKLAVGLPRRNAELAYLDAAASADVYSYDDVVIGSLGEATPGFPLIKTAVPSWDNDVRRQSGGLVVHGSTPAKYQAWLQALVARTADNAFFGEKMVCVNAWNEWAEGAYLEPDVHFGGAYANATGRAITSTALSSHGRLLLVGHDAFPAGAQHLLLNLLRTLRRNCGVEVEYLLLGGGALQDAYAAVAPGRVLAGAGATAALDELVAEWRGRGFTAALVNTTVAAWTVPVLHQAGIAASLLVHELPRLIQAKDLLPALRSAIETASCLVFPAASTRDRVAEVVPLPPERTRIMPQGIYRVPVFSSAARATLRANLGVLPATRLVLGAGYADLRKGFDLFLQCWRMARRRQADMLFCWVGDIDPALRAALGSEIAAAEATGSFRLPGYQSDMDAWYSAADLFALPSREDPYPSVVLEAIAAGLQVVAFDEAGGIPDLLRHNGSGVAVSLADPVAMLEALQDLPMSADEQRARMAESARRDFDFPTYAKWLLRLAQPALAEISVVVLSYNYARYLPERLGSIFAQTYPVGEVLLLDDASTDDSILVAQRVAGEWQRDLRIVVSPSNSGSVFAQWRKAAEQATGAFIWIAEADDSAEPEMLARLAGALRAAPDIDLAFCDSRSIDAEGQPIWPSYGGYYHQGGITLLDQDGAFLAEDFARRCLVERNLILNVSAVLWRRSALLAALDRCGSELDGYRLAGDWRLYVEALAGSGQPDGAGRHMAYVATPLNVHRRHGASVTKSLPVASQVDEIARVQRAIRTRLRLDDQAIERQETYLRLISGQLG